MGYRTYGYGKREAEPEAQYYGGLVGHLNGAVTPMDEPAVQAAKANHFAAKAATALYKPYSGLYNAGYSYGSYVRPSIYGGMGYHTYGYGKREAEPEAQYYGGYGYSGLVAHPNGAVVPVDEPAVQAVKADHFAAKATSGLYRPYSGLYNNGYSYGSYVRPSIYGGMGYRTYGYGKREAEAEPESQYYGGYGYSGLYKPYSGIYKPYSGIYNTGYNYGSYMKPSIYGAGYYYRNS